MNAEELKARSNKYAHRCVKLALSLRDGPRERVIKYQLIKAGTSTAANYRAACIAHTKATFIAKLSIVVEEADESVFWIEFIRDEKLLPQSRLDDLLKEGRELTAIFVQSRKTASRRK